MKIKLNFKVDKENDINEKYFIQLKRMYVYNMLLVTSMSIFKYVCKQYVMYNSNLYNMRIIYKLKLLTIFMIQVLKYKVQSVGFNFQSLRRIYDLRFFFFLKGKTEIDLFRNLLQYDLRLEAQGFQYSI